MSNMPQFWLSLWYINTVVVLQMSPDPIGYSPLCNWQYPECSMQEVDFHIQIKRSLGQNVVWAWWDSSSWLKQVLGVCTVCALGILSSARECEVPGGDETKTQEGMSDKGQGQRGKESFECEMENLKLPFVSMKACECSSVSPKTLFLHKSLWPSLTYNRFDKRAPKRAPGSWRWSIHAV